MRDSRDTAPARTPESQGMELASDACSENKKASSEQVNKQHGGEHTEETRLGIHFFIFFTNLRIRTTVAIFLSVLRCKNTEPNLLIEIGKKRGNWPS